MHCCLALIIVLKLCGQFLILDKLSYSIEAPCRRGDLFVMLEM